MEKRENIGHSLYIIMKLKRMPRFGENLNVVLTKF